MEEEFTDEPSTWPYFINWVSLTSFLLTLFFSVISPLLCPIISPKYYSLGDQKSHCNTMLSSTIHAVVSSILSTIVLAFGLLGTNRLFSTSPYGFAVLHISLGYFVADFLVCLWYPKLRNNVSGMTHHLAAIISILICLFFHGKLMFFAVYRAVSELSTPFVNLFWFLHSYNLKNTKWYPFASATMMITFILCRIIVIPWHWYEVLAMVFSPASFANDFIPLLYKIWACGTYLAIDIINVYWLRKMISGTIKLYSTRRV